MKIHNYLPVLQECLKKWSKMPTREEFYRDYYEPLKPWMDTLFADFAQRMGTDFYGVVEKVDWAQYLKTTQGLDPAFEEKRVVRLLGQLESLFGFPFQGDIVIFGAFGCMDGYARFHEGKHCVYLGVDESHGPGKYLDILISHELTHVARESRPIVWEGFGLSATMNHDDFVANQPVIEHLMGEGFSCTVSELVVPGQEAHHYCYQSVESLQTVYAHAAKIDQRIKEELLKENGIYRSLYDTTSYGADLPWFSHYVWAWQWSKKLLADHHGDVRTLVATCSKEFIPNALNYRLQQQ